MCVGWDRFVFDINQSHLSLWEGGKIQKFDVLQLLLLGTVSYINIVKSGFSGLFFQASGVVWWQWACEAPHSSHESISFTSNH